ncbi:type II secretory pathway, pseudopilin PulG [Thiohalobacter thiocyanaticus]|uniref:Type II secretion system protein H n=1 Tax=Thiohalobacter thiocyanaticus TaxID=585455 RepID=A0A1Z4VNV4_9GAMM|nr:type II secretion system minor pseudopilin GspH [Thiohalobacter thiocyanaticus]BAZ93173.1 type II secretory pathway, pseudopilin PulG [Thiohalobacter thiocyanaticus]
MNSSSPAARPTAGFTLFELLVVLAIVGILVTAVTLSVGGDRRGDALARESQRFAALVRLAAEQAVLRSEEWAVQVEPDRYRFLRLDETLGREPEWIPIEDDALFRTRELEAGTRLELELEGREMTLVDAEDEAGIKPTLLLLSSGEVSPFVAGFEARDTDSRFRVTSNLLGELEWERVEE